MRLQRIIYTVVAVLFLGILATYLKTDKKASNKDEVASSAKVQEIVLVDTRANDHNIAVEEQIKFNKVETVAQESFELKKEDLPDADRVEELFNINSKLPIVETITYSSRVPWLKGRPAWLADYASHYATSRHFIARSLNHKEDYFTQKVSHGDKFNVLRIDKNFGFYFILDLSRTKLWFYAVDYDTNEKILLKTYKVGVGRKDTAKNSECLTPTGKFTLGSKVAIYKPGSMGYFQDKKIEMRQVFGTRWIPFEKELEDCTDKAKGLGIHGTPWSDADGVWTENLEKIGQHDSDGCVRLSSHDIEEIFAIVISKPTIIDIVKDFHDSDLVKPNKTK